MHSPVQKTFHLRALFRFFALLALTFLIAPVGKADDQLKEILELRGYTRIGGQLEFSVYNKEEKRSRWLAIDKSTDGYRIKEYDRERNEIIIEFNGLEGRLPLEASRVAELKSEKTSGNDSTSDQEHPLFKPSRPSQRTGSNSSANTPTVPRALPPERTDRSRRNSNRNNNRSGGFSSGRGRKNSDSDSDDRKPSDKDDSSEKDNDPRWDDGIGEPPPIPTTPPPSYNPGS